MSVSHWLVALGQASTRSTSGWMLRERERGVCTCVRNNHNNDYAGVCVCCHGTIVEEPG